MNKAIRDFQWTDYDDGRMNVGARMHADARNHELLAAQVGPSLNQVSPGR